MSNVEASEGRARSVGAAPGDAGLAPPGSEAVEEPPAQQEAEAARERATVTAYRPSLLEGLRDAWRCRHAARGLATQFMTMRMPNMILGQWWLPLRLVLTTVAMAFIFGTVLSIPSAPGVPYFLFITAGLMGWFTFDRGSRWTMMSFHRFRRYVSNFSIPLVLIPFAGVSGIAIPMAFIGGFIAVVLLVYVGIDGRLYLELPEVLYLLPLSLAWLALAAVIVGLWTGPVFVRVRDVRQVFRLALPFWMYLTPVVYPLDNLSGTLKTVAAANPLAPPLLLFKQGLIGTAGPSGWSIASGLAVTAVFLVGGLWFTNRYGPALLARAPEGQDDEDALA